MSTIKSFHNVWAENPKSNRLRTISYPKIGTYCEYIENIYHEMNNKTKIIEGRVSLYKSNMENISTLWLLFTYCFQSKDAINKTSVI